MKFTFIKQTNYCDVSALNPDLQRYPSGPSGQRLSIIWFVHPCDADRAGQCFSGG